MCRWIVGMLVVGMMGLTASAWAQSKPTPARKGTTNANPNSNSNQAKRPNAAKAQGESAPLTIQVRTQPRKAEASAVATPRGPRLLNTLDQERPTTSTTIKRPAANRDAAVGALKGQMRSLGGGGAVTSARRAALRAHLQALFEGPSHPEAEVVAGLADELAWSLAAGRLDHAAVAHLADLMALIGGPEATAEERMGAIGEARGILDEGGATSREGQVVTSHLRNIAEAVGRGAVKPAAAGKR